MILSPLRRNVAALILFTGLLQTDASEFSKAQPHWTLKTSDTELVLGVDPDNQLRIYQLSSPAGWNWAKTPSPFPLLSQVEVEGVRKTLSWVYVKGAEDKRQGTLAITFSNANPAMELFSVWQARRGPGPVRHTVFLKNNSGAKLTIYEQESLDVQVTDGNETSTSVCYINDDGSLPDATGFFHDKLVSGYKKTLQISENQDFIPLTILDANGAHGIYVGWEWSIGRVAIDALATGSARIKAGNGDNFRTDLNPGEMFEVPPGFIGAYKGDLDDAANSLHKYLFNYSMPAILKNNSEYPKVEWNAFAATGKTQGSWDSTETKYYPLIDAIAPLGFEEVVLDVGWWQGDTTHKPHPPEGDRVDWASGILAARDYAHKKGMRFGLYWNCNPSMTSLAGIRHRMEDAQDLYDKFHIDFYRSDGTDGNVLQTGTNGPGMRAHYAEDVGYWQTKGYYQVLDSLYAAIPNFSYENCSGGGRIKDYGILKRSMKIQDQDRYYPIDVRQAFYDSSFALHPMQIACIGGSWAEWQASGSVYEFRSSSLGAAYWHPDAPNGGNGGPVWTASQKALIQEAVNTYKTMIRPLVRTANLYHIFPRPTDKIWDGIEYFDPETRKGAVYVFRPNSPVSTQAVIFKGLAPKATYWLWCEDGSFAPMKMDGNTLMKTGLPLSLPQTYTSEIIFIQDARLGKPDLAKAPGKFNLKPVKTSSQLVSTSAELTWEPSRNARKYRVLVSESPDFTNILAQELSTTPSLSLAKLPGSRQLFWKVEAISRGGTTANMGASGKFSTPEILARDAAFASDLKWKQARSGADTQVRRDANLHGKTIKINGRTIEKGLWIHSFNDNSPADIVFDLSDKKFATFKASVGLDDLGERGSVQFQVLVDGQKKAESPVLRPKKMQNLLVGVTGAKEVTLRVLNGGDGHGWDHAVWGMARFIEAGKKDPLEESR